MCFCVLQAGLAPDEIVKEQICFTVSSSLSGASFIPYHLPFLCLPASLTPPIVFMHLSHPLATCPSAPTTTYLSSMPLHQ